MSESANANQATHSYLRSYPWEESVPDRFARPTGPFPVFLDTEIEQSIPQRFAKIVAQHSGRLAVKDAHHELTYDNLNHMANRVAWHILAKGDNAPTVALLMEQGALSIVALMGVIKAGKAYVPLDPFYPPARLEDVLQDSQASLILSDSSNVARARELGDRTAKDSWGPVEVLNLEDLDHNLSTIDPELAISPDAHAYVIYTSGTTGQPKGVIGSHRQVLHFSQVYINSCHIGPQDRVSLVASLSYNDSLSHIFPALLNGAAVLPFDVKREGPARLANWLIRERITFHGCVPSLLRHICASIGENETFPDMRVVKLGGDRVDKGDLELFKTHFGPNCVLRVGYGASEAKFITQYFMNRDTQIDGVVPVGYPVQDVEVLLLDEMGQPVEVGQVGEIAVRSRYLSPGYWRRPEETEKKFLPDPDGGDRRVYLTGDLGRMAEDGCLTHVGRKDFQVKVRGYRVEIAEVEAALLDLEGVRQAVVIAQQRQGDDREGDTLRLVAYIVPDPSSEVSAEGLTTSDLRRRLAERLPDYMIPSAFVMLDEIPLTANGKIDRRALPEPDVTRPELDIPYVAPRDGIEGELVDIWEEILGIQPVGVKDSFYELGGNSLLVARLFAQVESRLFAQGESRPNESTRGLVSLETFFKFPTVEHLAQMYRQKMTAGDSLSGQPEQPRARRPAGSPRPRGSQRDPPLAEIKNRLLQVLALYAPGARTLRVQMHRMRGVRIGQDVFIGLGVILESGHPRMISIGNHVTISVRSVVIAHFGGSTRWARLNNAASVRIEDNVYIGPGVIILPNVTIGQGAVVAAGSIVNQSVPPLTMVQGNPARPVAECGIPLVGNTYEQFTRSLRLIEAGGKPRKGARRIE